MILEALERFLRQITTLPRDTLLQMPRVVATSPSNANQDLVEVRMWKKFFWR